MVCHHPLIYLDGEKESGTNFCVHGNETMKEQGDKSLTGQFSLKSYHNLDIGTVFSESLYRSVEHTVM